MEYIIGLGFRFVLIINSLNFRHSSPSENLDFVDSKIQLTTKRVSHLQSFSHLMSFLGKNYKFTHTFPKFLHGFECIWTDHATYKYGRQDLVESRARHS